MYSLNDSKIYTMYFYLTYPPPMTSLQHHTGPNSLSGSVNLVNIFHTDLFFLVMLRY